MKLTYRFESRVKLPKVMLSRDIKKFECNDLLIEKQFIKGNDFHKSYFLQCPQTFETIECWGINRSDFVARQRPINTLKCSKINTNSIFTFTFT